MNSASLRGSNKVILALVLLRQQSFRLIKKGIIPCSCNTSESHCTSAFECIRFIIVNWGNIYYSAKKYVSALKYTIKIDCLKSDRCREGVCFKTDSQASLTVSHKAIAKIKESNEAMGPFPKWGRQLFRFFVSFRRLIFSV